MKRILASLLLAHLPSLPLLAVNLTRAAEVTRFLEGTPSPQITFVLTGTVTHVESRMVYVQDDSGSVNVYNGFTPLAPGDMAVFNGIATSHVDGNASAQITNAAVILSHGKPPHPKSCDLKNLDSHALNRSLVSVCGTVDDVVRDEIDTNVVFLILKQGSASLPVAVRANEAKNVPLQDATVRIEGIYRRRVAGHRYFFGPFIYTTKPLVVLEPSPANAFANPPFSFYPLQTAEELYALPRHTLTGVVVASWRPNGILLHVNERRTVRVDLVARTCLPHVGDRIEVAGYPSTDLFNVNLTRATYRLAEDDAPPAPDSHLLAADTRMFSRPDPPTMFDLTTLHGRLGTVTGEIRESAEMAPLPGRYTLHCPSFNLTVDMSSFENPILPIGAQVRLTGVFMLSNDNWNPGNIFPHIRGIILLPRRADDIVVLSRPSWFTHRHLLAVIAVLLAGLLVFFLWNRALNRLVSRRGHELAREKLKKESAQLKIGERTRLAVELHDSLSQNLEGVACQLVASRNMLKANPSSAEGCLDTAERMLDSCRLELRRCLFDLRGHALEEQNFADAIRETLAPLCDGTGLVVRFDVRRAHFDDTTVHAVLCMVRELVSNALRHGHATQIRVAGEYHDGTLNFSVRDNGCGFDAEARPGPSQGHFGLEGIRERAERLDGTAVIESRPGAGTRIAVTLHLSEGKDAEPA